MKPASARETVNLHPVAAPVLGVGDRRLILTAALELLLRRARLGLRVTSDDVIRLAPYADPPGE